MNVYCRDKTVATDTIYYGTPTIDDGSTQTQLFFGTKSLVTYVYGMKTDKQFINILEDNIHARFMTRSFIFQIKHKIKSFHNMVVSL